MSLFVIVSMVMSNWTGIFNLFRQCEAVTHDRHNPIILKKETLMRLKNTAFAFLAGTTLLISLFSIPLTPAFAEEQTPSASDQVAGIQKMCADSKDAIQQRQAQKSLYTRLGKKPRIKLLAKNILAAHSKNPKISPGRISKEISSTAFLPSKILVRCRADTKEV